MYKIALILILFILAAFSAPQPDNNDGEVMKVAKKNLASWLAQIPAGQESVFGFNNREEFTTANIAKPFRIITLNKNFFVEETLSDKNYLLMQNEWRVPVMAKGKNSLLLTVSRQDTTFSAVDMGGATLAKELQQKDIEPALNNQYILRIYPLACDFLVKAVAGKPFNEATYIPLTSAVMAIKELGDKKTFTLIEILPLVKQQLKVQPKY